MKEVVAVLIGMVIRINYSSPGSRIGASGSSSVSNMNGKNVLVKEVLIVKDVVVAVVVKQVLVIVP